MYRPKRSFLCKLCLYCKCNSIIMMICHMQLFYACVFFASNYSCWSDKSSLYACTSVHFPAGHQWLPCWWVWSEIQGIQEWNYILIISRYLTRIMNLFPGAHFHECTSTHFQGALLRTSWGALLCTSRGALLRTSNNALLRTPNSTLLRTSGNALLCTPTSFKYLHPHFDALAHSYALPSAHFHALAWAHFYALPTAHFYALQPHLHICTRTFTHFQRTSMHSYALLCTPN